MLSLTLPSRKKLSTSHAFQNGCTGFSCQGERLTHSAALLQTEQQYKGMLCCLLPLENISNPPRAYSRVCTHTWASYSSENVRVSLCARFSSCVGTAGWAKSLDKLVNPLHAKFQLRAVFLVAQLNWPFS